MTGGDIDRNELVGASLKDSTCWVCVRMEGGLQPLGLPGPSAGAAEHWAPRRTVSPSRLSMAPGTRHACGHHGRSEVQVL